MNKSQEYSDNINPNWSPLLFQLYEKKQERFLNKVTNITNNKRLRKIERKLTEVHTTGDKLNPNTPLTNYAYWRRTVIELDFGQ